MYILLKPYIFFLVNSQNEESISSSSVFKVCVNLTILKDNTNLNCISSQKRNSCVCLSSTSTPCKYLYDPTCTNDLDCCSGHCYLNNGNWTIGICEPSRDALVIGKTCSALHIPCTRNTDCCSSFCAYKPSTTATQIEGYCNLPDVQVIVNCKPLNGNTCTLNAECCSGFRDRNNGAWEVGVCQTVGTIQTGCKPLYDNTCKANGDCCSGYCNNNNGATILGVCQVGANIIGTTCKPMNDNTCTSNSECCTGFCNNNNGAVPLGVCQVPGPTVITTFCKPLNDNTCTSHAQCCTGFCNTNNGALTVGVCTRVGTTCKPLNDNTCTVDSQCCTGFCSNGVCLVPGTTIIGSTCKPLYDNTCSSNAQYCSGYCNNHNGALALGVCQNAAPITSKSIQSLLFANNLLDGFSR